MKIYLASASPRRKELLEQIGLEFEVMASNVGERITAAEPGEVVEELSAQKAGAVMEELTRKRETAMEEPARRAGAVMEELTRKREAAIEEPARRAGAGSGDSKEPQGVSCGGILVIGADTVVASDGRILGKPANPQEAAKMLRQLSGNTHEVYTGVTLLYRTAVGSLQRRVFHERTRVTFFSMSEAEIERYVSTGDCLDKAGAYGIQGFCARYIRGIEGDYNNVVGLPVGRLYQEAKEWLEA